MELIKNFGIDPILLGAQIVNFLIVLYLLKKFLYKPVISLLQKRQETIKIGLRQSEEARIRMEKVLDQEKIILKNAVTEAKKIIDDAKLESLKIAKEIEESAKDNGEKIMRDAKEQIEHDTKEAEKTLAINISSLAVKFLEKYLASFFSERDQEEILKKAVKRIKGVN